MYLYPNERVPITIITLNVDEHRIPLLVTARPYHPNEIGNARYAAYPSLLLSHTVATLPEYVKHNPIDLPEHFYPHIRGLFAGRRRNNFFWYPLNVSIFWDEFGEKIEASLRRRRLQWIGIYEEPYMGGHKYTEVWNELLDKKTFVDQRKPTWVDFRYSEVSADEFLQDYTKTDENLLFFYPVKFDEIEHTLPVVVANRTHVQSKVKSPVVLGVYAENGGIGYARRGGILRIRDRRLAQYISNTLTGDFEVPIDTVLFTPQKGRPKYERIQPV